MKITIVTPIFPPYRGGIGEAAYLEAVELARRGHEISVYTPKNLSGNLMAKNFKLHRLMPFLKYGKAAFLPQLFWKLPRTAGDVIHLHYPFFGGAEVVYKLKVKSEKSKVKLKLIITYHHDVIGNGLLGRFFRWHTRHFMPKILDAADKIIVSSFDHIRNSDAKEIFAKYPEKFFEVPFGVDTQKFKPEAKDYQLLAKYNSKTDDPPKFSQENLSGRDKIILFVGGLDKAYYFKGIEQLLSAKCKVQSAKLLIVGGGDLRSHYEELADDLKIKDQVIFAGTVSDEDLPKYYNLADLVVLPSFESEAFGIVLIEGMACGKPTVASNLPGVRSVVGDGKNGFLVEPKNVDQLAEKINILLSNSELRKQFGENGRKKVLEKYSIEKMGEKLEKVLCQ
jgi:glycosyltransferase involved in cell wall biosynthesis